MLEFGYDYHEETPGDRLVVDDPQPLMEHHLFTNGWGLEVHAYIEHGFTHINGVAQVLAPVIKGNRLVWSAQFDEPVPEHPQLGRNRGTMTWASIEELGRLIEAVRSFPEYVHECDRHCGSCDGHRC